MAQGFTITCLASNYSDASGFSVSKGWKSTRHEADPLCARLKGESAFAFEPCEVPDPIGVMSPAPDNTPAKSSETDDITLVEALEPKLLGLLHEAGYLTVGDVLLASDKLTEITGIGQATANKVIAACEGYLTE